MGGPGSSFSPGPGELKRLHQKGLGPEARRAGQLVCTCSQLAQLVSWGTPGGRKAHSHCTSLVPGPQGLVWRHCRGACGGGACAGGAGSGLRPQAQPWEHGLPGCHSAEHPEGKALACPCPSWRQSGSELHGPRRHRRSNTDRAGPGVPCGRWPPGATVSGLCGQGDGRAQGPAGAAGEGPSPGCRGLSQRWPRSGLLTREPWRSRRPQAGKLRGGVHTLYFKNTVRRNYTPTRTCYSNRTRSRGTRGGVTGGPAGSRLGAAPLGANVTGLLMAEARTPEPRGGCHRPRPGERCRLSRSPGAGAAGPTGTHTELTGSQHLPPGTRPGPLRVRDALSHPRCFPSCGPHGAQTCEERCRSKKTCVAWHTSRGRPGRAVPGEAHCHLRSVPGQAPTQPAPAPSPTLGSALVLPPRGCINRPQHPAGTCLASRRPAS